MTRFSDELLGSEGEWCWVAYPSAADLPNRSAIIRAVHDGGRKVTVQYEDNDTALVSYDRITLISAEDEMIADAFRPGG